MQLPKKVITVIRNLVDHLQRSSYGFWGRFWSYMSSEMRKSQNDYRDICNDLLVRDDACRVVCFEKWMLSSLRLKNRS